MFLLIRAGVVLVIFMFRSLVFNIWALLRWGVFLLLTRIRWDLFYVTIILNGTQILRVRRRLFRGLWLTLVLILYDRMGLVL